MFSFPPKGTVDCHTHVAGSADVYPMVSPRAYTPETAEPEQMRAMMNRVGIDRIILVQMSVYGTDNSCMLDGISTLGSNARGVAQVAADCGSVELDRLHNAGVRGIRINLNTTGINDPDLARQRLEVAARQCERNGWHLQLFTSPAVIAEIGAVLDKLPVPIVFDHFGLLSPVNRGSPAEVVVRNIISKGRGWIKLSGTYRLSHPSNDEKIALLARDLFNTNPERALWGSDWPHTPPHAAGAQNDPAPAAYRDVDPKDMLITISNWFENDAEREQILVTNPASLYFQ